MRSSRGFLWGVAASLLIWSSSAQAQLFVVAPAGAPDAIAHVELGYAIGQGAPVTWLSVRAEHGPLALVAALPAGASLRPGLDAWFAALEATASPNVLPPKGAEPCGETAGFAHVAWARARGSAPTELALETADDVRAALTDLGLEPSSPLPDAPGYVVWAWPERTGVRTTRTMRIEGGEPLALLPGPAIPVLVSTLTGGATSYPDELDANELGVTFVPGMPAQSDYVPLLREWLAAAKPPLLELRARGPLFDWSLYQDTLSLSPLVRSYADRAASELTSLDAKACAHSLTAFRRELAPDHSACGDALDAALALAASGGELSTLQRFAVSGRVGFDPSRLFAGGEAREPLLRASAFDPNGCDTVPLPPITREPPATGPVASPSSPGKVVVVEEHVVVDDHDYDSDVEVSCWGSPGPGPGDDYAEEDEADCSSDSSSSSGDGEVDCSSDSSSSSSDGEADCSSDSSSSSESDADCGGDTSTSHDTSDGVDCSSDTSSSSDGDSGCDGGSDESSGYDGDTCTGSAAPRAEPRAQQRASLSASKKPRRQRLKTSLWSLGFAAFVLPIRRRKRRARTVG
jgi:hypothetical protein